MVFTPRIKLPTHDIPKFLLTTLRNQDNKIAFIRVDKHGALEISSEFMKTFNNMNIIVQNIGGDASFINVKINIHNKTLANIKRYPLLN